jgi:hypothetical protein
MFNRSNRNRIRKSKTAKRERGKRTFLSVEGLESRLLLDSSPSQLYVRQVYRDLLGREADASGLSYFSGVLDQGQPRINVVQGITGSPEYRTLLVAGLYRSLLQRAPDTMGENGWVGALGAGATVEQVKTGFLSSPEYFQTRGTGTNSGFLAALYQDELHRAVDPSATSGWGVILNAGQAVAGQPSRAFVAYAALTRAFVAYAVLTSPEGSQDQVTDYYQCFLHRAPDPVGLTDGSGLIESGAGSERVVTGLTISDEYFNLTQHNNGGQGTGGTGSGGQATGGQGTAGQGSSGNQGTGGQGTGGQGNGGNPGTGGQGNGGSQTGQISGTVYLDLDGQGFKNDTSYTGQAITIDLSLNGAKVASTSTDTQGNYAFTGLGATGTYTAQEAVPGAWTLTAQTGNSIVASSGFDSTGNNFADFQNGQISGTVFQDNDGNGFKNDSPYTGPAVTVNLYQNGGSTPKATTSTDTNGNYAFPNLGPGTYTVQEITPAGWTETAQTGATITATSGFHSPGNNFADFQNSQGPGTGQGLTITAPVAGADHSTTARLIGSAGKAASANFSLDGGPAVPVMLDAMGRFDQALSSTPLAVGTHQVVVQAQNAGGNPVQRTVDFNVSADFTVGAAGTAGWGYRTSTAVHLEERNSFDVQVSTSVALGGSAGSRTLRFSVSPTWDQTGPSTASGDHFLVYLVDPNNPGQTLLASNGPGTPLLTLSRHGPAEFPDARSRPALQWHRGHLPRHQHRQRGQ